MNSGKTIAESRVTLSALMGPQDANVLGNVHGGVIMKLVDEAGALAAMRHARCPVVTVAIDSMTFLEPIYLGHMVSCQAELTYAGHTAMEVRIAVIAENPLTGQTIHTNLAYGVYVAIDLQTRRPHPVPPLIAETEEQQRRMEAARQRQAERKRRRVQEDVP
jgi:acyl-CoA hydrolase